MIIMKTLTSLLIGCSLALAGAALAQQPVEQQSPSKGKQAPEKAHAAQGQPQPNAAKPHAPSLTHQGATQQHRAAHDVGAMKEHGTATPHGATHEHAAANESGAAKSANAPAHQESATSPQTNESGESADTSTPTARQQRVEQRSKGMKGQATAPNTSTNAAGAAAGAGAASSGAAAGQQNEQANAGAKAKKPDPQQVQQIKNQHGNFRAQ